MFVERAADVTVRQNLFIVLLTNSTNWERSGQSVRKLTAVIRKDFKTALYGGPRMVSFSAKIIFLPWPN